MLRKEFELPYGIRPHITVRAKNTLDTVNKEEEPLFCSICGVSEVKKEFTTCYACKIEFPIIRRERTKQPKQPTKNEKRIAETIKNYCCPHDIPNTISYLTGEIIK